MQNLKFAKNSPAASISATFLGVPLLESTCAVDYSAFLEISDGFTLTPTRGSAIGPRLHKTSLPLPPIILAYLRPWDNEKG